MTHKNRHRFAAPSVLLGALVTAGAAQLASATEVGSWAQTGLAVYDANGVPTYGESCPGTWQLSSASCSGADTSAYAALPGGVLNAQYTEPPSPGGGHGTAHALLSDFLKFSGTAPGQSITITETATGSSSGDSVYGAIELAVAFNEQLNAPDAFDLVTWAWTIGSASSGCESASGFSDVTVCRVTGGTSLSVSYTIPVSEIHSADGLYLQFLGECIDGGSDSNGSTCTLIDPITITTPPGVTYTSASGLFLTAVPLPAGAWLLLSGLGALAGLRRTQGATAR